MMLDHVSGIFGKRHLSGDEWIVYRGREQACARPPAQIPACALTHGPPASDDDERPLVRPRVLKPVAERPHQKVCSTNYSKGEHLENSLIFPLSGGPDVQWSCNFGL